MRFVACLIFAIAIVALAFHCAKPLPKANFDESFLPKASSVKYLAVGNNTTAAGLFWIKGLTELGESYLTGKEYGYLAHIANLSTELDSLFYTPYYFIGGITPINSKDTSDFVVLRRASNVFPENWRLSLYYALRLAKGPYKNRQEAAHVMKRYFDSPDTTIPSHIRTIYRSFELDTMQTEMALETIINDIAQPQFEKFRNSFYIKIFKLLADETKVANIEKDDLFLEIKNICELMIARQIHPQQAYVHLLQLKKREEEKEAKIKANAADSTAIEK